MRPLPQPYKAIIKGPARLCGRRCGLHVWQVGLEISRTLYRGPRRFQRTVVVPWFLRLHDFGHWNCLTPQELCSPGATEVIAWRYPLSQNIPSCSRRIRRVNLRFADRNITNLGEFMPACCSIHPIHPKRPNPTFGYSLFSLATRTHIDCPRPREFVKPIKRLDCH